MALDLLQVTYVEQQGLKDLRVTPEQPEQKVIPEHVALRVFKEKQVRLDLRALKATRVQEDLRVLKVIPVMELPRLLRLDITLC
jgi:hypothetical protein